MPPILQMAMRVRDLAWRRNTSEISRLKFRAATMDLRDACNQLLSESEKTVGLTDDIGGCHQSLLENQKKEEDS